MWHNRPMNGLGKIIQFSKPFHKLLVIISLLILFNAAITLVTPFLTKNVIDNIHDPKILATNIIYIFLVSIFGVFITSISNKLGDTLSAKLTVYLTDQFYSHTLKLSQEYFDSKMSGKIANQLKRGILSIGEFVGAATNFILPSIMQTIFTIGALTYQNRLIGLLAFILFPIYIYISHRSTKLWAKSETKKNKLDDEYTSRIVEALQNMKLIKVTSSQKDEMEYIDERLSNYRQIYAKQSTQYHLINTGRNIILEGVMIVIIIIALTQVTTGVLTLGALVMIIQLLSLLRRPLFSMSFMLERVQRANTGAKEYFDIINLPTNETIADSRIKPLYSNPTINLKQVSFSLNQKSIINNASLTIKPGENVAIIGPSGAGKTTLVNLMLRLYEPTKGYLSLDDKKYTDLTYQQTRSHFAYVFQDNELFSTTVKENVSYGQKSLSTKIINEALKNAHAYDFVMAMPDKINSQIGERGIKLSGGQKQRLQIARALANPAPILILDEATSSLDAKSESLIQQALLSATKTKTVIIIAHRFSTLQNVDRIIVIDKGKIVDQGSPATLAAKPGIFKELLQYQIQGNQKLLAKYDIIE